MIASNAYSTLIKNLKYRQKLWKQIIDFQNSQCFWVELMKTHPFLNIFPYLGHMINSNLISSAVDSWTFVDNLHKNII